MRSSRLLLWLNDVYSGKWSISRPQSFNDNRTREALKRLHPLSSNG